MIKVGDKVLKGLFEGVVIKIYTFRQEEWARVDFGGDIGDVKLKELRKVEG